MDQSVKRIIVGISGASGAAYAQRMVQLLLAAGVETHLVVSPLGQRLLNEELGMQGVDLNTLAGLPPVSPVPPVPPGDNRLGTDGPVKLIVHNHRDVGAVIASGSFRHDGMIVIPCSSNTLSCIAHGSAQNLMHRAAHVTLKERRRLVLVHRETPLSLVDIRNMQAVTEAGGIIAPANPGFYMLPKTIEAVVDFVVGRCLDLLGVGHSLDVRWAQQKMTDTGASADRGKGRGRDTR